ncbi:MAG: alpha/beta hydrolase [Proteobacteria bacterium]|nr:alpha/beta hydrolase [Pseudomonadota bacterium]
MMARYDTVLPPGADALQVADLRLPGFAGPVDARLYRPADIAGPVPAVLYFHGGGFVAGDLDEADPIARRLAATIPAAVLSVAYSLAPAHPFPAAPEDAHAAALWLHAQAASFGIDAARLACAGHDAGATLAAALTLMARDRLGPPLVAQALVGPMLDPSQTRQDHRAGAAEPRPDACARCYSQYLPRVAERLHPYATPLESRRLAGLPPALIATGAHDRLRCEAEHYGAALINAGVPTQVTRYTAGHAELPAHPALRGDLAAFLRHHLWPAPAFHPDFPSFQSLKTERTS